MEKEKTFVKISNREIYDSLGALHTKVDKLEADNRTIRGMLAVGGAVIAAIGGLFGQHLMRGWIGMPELSNEAWTNLKWGMALLICAFLVYSGKLDSQTLIGLVAGLAVPVTDIMQRAGLVAQPK